MASRFSQGLKSLGKDDPKPRKPSAPAAKPKPAIAPVETQEPPVAASYMAPSRRGKKAVTGYFDPTVRQQLAVLAAEEQRSQNDLLAEALNLLFETHGKSPIARG
jgi:hypothetical protein